MFARLRLCGHSLIGLSIIMSSMITGYAFGSTIGAYTATKIRNRWIGLDSPSDTQSLSSYTNGRSERLFDPFVGFKGAKIFIGIATVGLFSLLPIALIPSLLLQLLPLLSPPIVSTGRQSAKLNITNSTIPTTRLIREENVTTLTTNWLSSTSTESPEKDETFVHEENIFAPKESSDRCLERIACEGLFTTIPRILLRVVGQNSFHVLRKKREDLKSSKYLEKERNNKRTLPRRKDLATLALNKLKNPQYLTRYPPNTTPEEKPTDACKMYKCSTFF